MPVSLTILFRTLIVLALSAHVFMMYGMARTMRETFGFDMTTTLIAAAFAFFLLLPFVWAVLLADVPAMLTRHRARRRFNAGCCPGCGYQLAAAGATTCSECGATMVEPVAYQASGATVRRFIVLNLIALVVGIASSETWLVLDEHRFRAHVENANLASPGTTPAVFKSRVDPFGNASMIYTPTRGFSAND